MENNSPAPAPADGVTSSPVGGVAGGTAPSARNAGIQRADGTPVRVLVVDDEPSLAELLASVLRYEGWNVRTAGSGADAVRTAREFRPDAVVLDIMLPDFNGIEVMRRLRAEVPQVCVLFLTARDAQNLTEFYKLKSGWRACYLSGHPADTCDDENGPIYPLPEATHLQQKLDYLRATRQNLFADSPGR